MPKRNRKVRREECKHNTYVEALTKNNVLVYIRCLGCGANITRQLEDEWIEKPATTP